MVQKLGRTASRCPATKSGRIRISATGRSRDRRRCCRRPNQRTALRGSAGSSARINGGPHDLRRPSICTIRGLRASFEEPDLVVRTRGLRLGIAAKRLTTFLDATFRQRVKEASDQLRGSGTRGLVCLHVTEVMAPGREILPPVAADSVVAWFEQGRSEFEKEWRPLLDPAYALGITLFWDYVTLDKGTCNHSSFLATVGSRDDHPHDRKLGDQLERALAIGAARADQL